jgi:hypothetical protein
MTETTKNTLTSTVAAILFLVAGIWYGVNGVSGASVDWLKVTISIGFILASLVSLVKLARYRKMIGNSS